MSDLMADVKLNKLNLDEEYKRQPHLYAKWATLHVRAQDARDRAKQRLEIKKAQLDAHIRANWQALGFDKRPTEPAIDNWILLNDDYQAIQNEMLEYTRQVNMFHAARLAMEHRRTALDGLVTLFKMNYFGSLTSSSTEREEQHKMVADELQRNLADSPRMRRGENDDI